VLDNNPATSHLYINWLRRWRRS